MLRTSTALITVLAAGSTVWANAAEASPYTKPDDSYISIDGTVDSVSRDSFLLDYGQGVVTVEFDDGDRDADAYKLVEGDRVSVSGVIDDDFYELTTIEASSVYVESLGTYFYASAADEEDPMIVVTPLVTSSTTVQGTVSGTDDDSFSIDIGARELTVETEEMIYDPLDDEGYQKIEKGDIVSVTGNMNTELFDGRVMEADTVTTLFDSQDQ
ncbi:MAG: OB-fold nucleic acid binding domain-containing protein [Chromatocurvus sp.]